MKPRGPKPLGPEKRIARSVAMPLANWNFLRDYAIRQGISASEAVNRWVGILMDSENNKLYPKP